MNNDPKHHLDDEALVAYASGALGEAESVLVATHLALCPSCRKRVSAYEAVGGSLIDAIAPAEMNADALSSVMAMLDGPTECRRIEVEAQPRVNVVAADDSPGDDVAAERATFDSDTLTTLPEPLRTYVGGNLDALPWKSRGRGVKEFPIDIGSGEVRASLLRIKPGERIPQHTHDGVESTLVLKGAFSDETGRYGRGDVAVATEDHDHAPVADKSEECICFAVIEGPLRFTGPIGRVLNLFVRT